MYNNPITASAVSVTAAGAGVTAADPKAGHAVTSLIPSVVHGSLAFTGINVAFMVCAGFAIIAAGLALVRLAPRFSLRRR